MGIGSRLGRGAAVCGLLVAVAASASAAPWKLATLVPDGSVWDRALRDMGAELDEATDGRVSLRVYPGGVAGDETDIVRKMRIGQLHAAAITVGGLAEIDDAFSVFATPLLIDSYDELAHVLERLRPELARRLEEKGFQLLLWGHGGWVHVFSKRPIRTLDDLKAMKLFAWAGDDDRVQLFRESGFQPVALATTDVLTGLQTGLIEAYPTPPLAALSLQWFRSTPYMADIGFAPLVGAVVVGRKSWQRLSPEDQARVMAVAERIEARLAREIPEQDAAAVEAMTARGLEVTAIADPEAWQQAAAAFVATSRERLVPAVMLDAVTRELEAFREAEGVDP